MMNLSNSLLENRILGSTSSDQSFSRAIIQQEMHLLVFQALASVIRKPVNLHKVVHDGYVYTKCFTSSFLVFQENPSKHPIIILKDVPFSHLQAILEYMYAGEVNVAQADLPNFLKTAERLKVKGLAEVNQNERQDR